MKLPKLPRPSRLHFYVNLSVGICFLLAIFGCLRAAGTLSAKYPDTNECDNTGSRTAVERQFQINLVIASGLSFAQAKILDLVWDIAIAQGGRLLHGWILYHVTCHALTWSLERSSLPYSFLLNLFLWPDSVFSFWSSVSYLGRDKRPLALLAVTFAYAIAHVLFFSAVWSAATGYQTPGTIAYAMPDGSWVAKDNDTLRLCWALKEPKRLPLGSQVSPDGVILGPTFGSHLRSFTDLDSTFANGGIWDFIPRLADNVSDDFYNMYSCKLQCPLFNLGSSRPCNSHPSDNLVFSSIDARSKNSLRTFLRDPGLWIPSSSRLDTVITWNATRLQQFSWFDDFNPRGFTDLDYNSRNRFQPGGDMKPTIIEGWQFLGVQQNLSVRAEELFWITHTFGEHSKQGRFGEDKEHQPDTQETQFLHSTFHLNISSSTLAQDAIPYNSTISFNGTTISLEAPFLNFVSWYARSSPTATQSLQGLTR